MLPCWTELSEDAPGGGIHESRGEPRADPEEPSGSVRAQHEKGRGLPFVGGTVSSRSREAESVKAGADEEVHGIEGGKEADMLTMEQKRGIRSVTGLSMRYQDDFDRRWADAMKTLQESRANLGRIRLVIGVDRREGC